MIKASASASAEVFRYLRERGIEHSGEISGATLGAVCLVSANEPDQSKKYSRTWRKWVAAGKMPLAAWRLLEQVSGLDVGDP